MVYKFIERSKGVVIFAVSLITFGAFNTFLLVLSLSLLSLKDTVPGFGAQMPNGVLSMPLFWMSSGLNFLIFISWVITGIGALRLKEWARQYLKVAMAVHIINMLINICLNIFLAEEMLARIPLGFLLAGIALSFFYYFVVIYFFSHPDIVRQFKYGTLPGKPRAQL